MFATAVLRRSTGLVGYASALPLLPLSAPHVLQRVRVHARAPRLLRRTRKKKRQIATLPLARQGPLLQPCVPLRNRH